MSAKFRRPPRVSRMLPFGGPSVWLEFSPLAQVTGAINLGQGSPGWSPPVFVTSSLTTAVQDPSHSQYARSFGAQQLIQQISRVYTPRVVPPSLKHSRCIDPHTEVLVTIGATHALYTACNALLDVGDEAVLIAPAFDIYGGAVALAGANAVYVPLRPRSDDCEVASSKDLVLDMDEFARSFTHKTKLLILNSPHNPTGKVFTREEYKAIAAVLDEKAPQCAVVSDEVYEHLVFEGEHVPFASVSESAFARTLSVYSAGKTFSATGLKIGWVIGPAELLRDLQLAHQFISFSVCSVSQVAIADALRIAEEAYEGHENYYKWLCALYRGKRDIFISAIREAGMNPIKPEGAFYICTKVPESHPSRAVPGLPESVRRLVEEKRIQIDDTTVDTSDYNVCRNMVAQYGVAAIPVSAFCPEEQVGKIHLATDCIRFAFCKPDADLEEAKTRICSEPK